MTGFDRSRLRTILFDLDGTLLQVEMQQYIPIYAAALAASLRDHAPTAATTEAVFSGITALIRRDAGDRSNLAFFQQQIAARLDIDEAVVADRFAGYFHGDLSPLDPLMQPLPLATALIEACRVRDLEVVIATNPVFPRPVVEARLARAGLADIDFRLITCAENSRRCKPNPDYFSDILATLGRRAADCLMVGNDTGHDLAARRVGIPTFLVDTWLIDRCRGTFVTDLRGDHQNLFEFIATLGNGGDY